MKKAKPENKIDCTVYLADRAVSDLIGIENYSVSNWGKKVAGNYLLKFEKAFKLLEFNPELARANLDLGKTLLFYRVEKHILVFIRVGAGLAVLTVAHASRDLETLLHDLAPTLKVEANALLQRVAKR